MTALPAPEVFGFSKEKFPHWRKQQHEATTRALEAFYSDKRFIVQCAPVGSGKSLSYVALARLTGARTLILTSSKGLQDQLARDFGDLLVDIRGRANYTCRELNESQEVWSDSLTGRYGCDVGPCLAGAKCDLKENGGCYYYDARRVASYSKIVVTNYSYWFYLQKSRDGGLGDFDLLVIDEAHEAPAELAAFMRLSVWRHAIDRVPGVNWPWGMSPGEQKWKSLIRLWQPLVEDEAKTLAHQLTSDEFSKSKAKRLNSLRALSTELMKITQLPSDWIFEHKSDEAAWEPLWPAPFAEANLFRGIPKVVLTSATVTPKTLELLGVKPEEYVFSEYPSSFPKERRPIIWIPTARIDRRSQDADLQQWAVRIDQIIGRRLDRKGIVHTVSFERAKALYERSSNKGIMLLNNSRDTRAIVERFKGMAPPAVLVSPSVTTGYDFPYDACRYIVIAKIPFPDTRSASMKARQEADKDYGNFLAMIEIQQASGRGMRAEDDYSEVLIVDDHWSWFLKKNRKFAAQWFLEACKAVDYVPAPLDLGA